MSRSCLGRVHLLGFPGVGAASYSHSRSGCHGVGSGPDSGLAVVGVFERPWAFVNTERDVWSA